MIAKTFVDTNILIYAHDLSEKRKHEVAKVLLLDLWASRTGLLSAQVLQEFYVNVTRKISKPISRKAARDVIETYGPWYSGPIEPIDIVRASRIEERHSLSFWDSLIIVAATRGGAVRILSEDLNSGQTIEGVTIENPFAQL